MYHQGHEIRPRPGARPAGRASRARSRFSRRFRPAPRPGDREGRLRGPARRELRPLPAERLHRRPRLAHPLCDGPAIAGEARGRAVPPRRREVRLCHRQLQQLPERRPGGAERRRHAGDVDRHPRPPGDRRQADLRRRLLRHRPLLLHPGPGRPRHHRRHHRRRRRLPLPRAAAQGGPLRLLRHGRGQGLQLLRDDGPRAQAPGGRDRPSRRDLRRRPPVAARGARHPRPRLDGDPGDEGRHAGRKTRRSSTSCGNRRWRGLARPRPPATCSSRTATTRAPRRTSPACAPPPTSPRLPPKPPSWRPTPPSSATGRSARPGSKPTRNSSRRLPASSPPSTPRASR